MAPSSPSATQVRLRAKECACLPKSATLWTRMCEFSACYAGDTTPTKAFVDLAKGSDVIIHEVVGVLPTTVAAFNALPNAAKNIAHVRPQPIHLSIHLSA
jgi:hypothetical protein